MYCTWLGIFLVLSGVHSIWAEPYFYHADGKARNSYIVKLKRDQTQDSFLGSLAKAFPGETDLLYKYNDHFFHGAAVHSMREDFSAYLMTDDSIDYIAEDSQLDSSGTQETFVEYGLARLSSATQELRQPLTYKYPDSAGKNAHVYVVDSGINLAHADFWVSENDETSRATCGYSVGNDNCRDDLGHGTAVASLVGGRGVGTAKRSNIIGVKVYHPEQKTTYMADVLAGLNFVFEDTNRRKSFKRANVVNLSWNTHPNDLHTRDRGPGDWMTPLDEGVSAILQSGAYVVNSAGNLGVDACAVGPRHPRIIKVGALQPKTDVPTSWSNYGPCVTFWATGEDVVAARKDVPMDYDFGLFGTSFAAPRVAGVVGLYLTEYGPVPFEELISLMKNDVYERDGRLIPQAPEV